MHRRFVIPSRSPSPFNTDDDHDDGVSSDEESESESEEEEEEGEERTISPPPCQDPSVGSTWNWHNATTHAIFMYTALIIVHYAGANLYSRLCTSPTLQGLFMSPFLVPSPHCQGLRWIVYHGADRIHGMWLLLGSQVVACVARLFVSKPTTEPATRVQRNQT